MVFHGRGAQPCDICNTPEAIEQHDRAAAMASALATREESRAMERQNVADIYRREDERVATAQAAVRAAHRRLEAAVSELGTVRAMRGLPARRTSDALLATRGLVAADALRRVRDAIGQHNNSTLRDGNPACYDLWARIQTIVAEGLGLEGGR